MPRAPAPVPMGGSRGRAEKSRVDEFLESTELLAATAATCCGCEFGIRKFKKQDSIDKSVQRKRVEKTRYSSFVTADHLLPAHVASKGGLTVGCAPPV